MVVQKQFCILHEYILEKMLICIPHKVAFATFFPNSILTYVR